MATRRVHIAKHSYELANHRWRPKAVIFDEHDEIIDMLYFPEHAETYATEGHANEVAEQLAKEELRRRGGQPTGLEARLRDDRPLLDALAREEQNAAWPIRPRGD